MNFLLELIKKVLYLIPLILILAFLFILVRFTLKSLNINISSPISSFGKKDYLPAPGTFGSSYGKAPTPTETPTNPTMEELNPWMQTGEYSYNGTVVDYTQANSQVRNIVIGSNNSLHSGVLVTGTARNVFFTNGKFQVLIVDVNGKVLGSTVAMAQTNPMENTWTPWQAKFNTVGVTTDNCMLILQNQNNSGDPRLSKVIRIPASCY